MHAYLYVDIPGYVNVFMCMYACMNVCMYVCMHVSMYELIYLRTLLQFITEKRPRSSYLAA
jgi:hypothetical protein